MANGPDISVRLSAQGVQDVIAAMRRVRQEGKDTGTALSGIGDSIKELLPAVTLAATVGGLTKLVLETREAEEALGKMSEKTGASVGTLSVLGLAAHDSEVDLSDLSAGLVKLAKSQVAAADGSSKQMKVFQSLGISIKDLKTLDPAALFVKVASALNNTPAGAQKTADVLALFGKSGAELIPLLDSIGQNQGFDDALTKAKKLGLYLDQDMVDSARSAQDAVHDLEDIASGIGTQFLSGFAPRFTQAVNTIAESVSGTGVNAVQEFGAEAGKAFEGIIDLLLIIGSLIKTVFTNGLLEIKYDVGQIKALGQGFVAGGISGAVANFADYSKTNRAAVDAEETKNADAFKAYYNELNNQYKAGPQKPKRTTKPDGTFGADGDGTDPEKAAAAAAKAAKAYSDLLQARAENELAIERALAQNEAADDKRKYDAGLISLDAYYDAREKRINDATVAEAAILEKKYNAALALPQGTPELDAKRQQTLEQIQSQAAQLYIKSQGDIKAAEDDRSKASQEAGEKNLQMQQRLAQMQGDRSKAQQLALDIELKQYADLLQKQGMSADQIAKATKAYKDQGDARIAFGAKSEAGSLGLSSLNTDISGIQTQAGAGVISQIQASAQIINLEKDRLSHLQEIGDEMTRLAALSNDPQLIEQAKQYNEAVQRIGLSFKDVTTFATNFSNVMLSQGYGALTDFFTAGISGAKSFGDAMGDLANTFEQMIGRMISQMIVFYTLQALVGWIAPNSSLATSLSKSSPFSFGGGRASGGRVANGKTYLVGEEGPELLTMDAGGGFVTPNRDLASVIAAGSNMPAFATPASYAAMASAQSGGGSGGVDASSLAPIINITTPPGTQTQTTQRTGSNGQSVTDIVVAAVVGDIGRRGPIAKTLETTYGMTRQGTRRSS